MMCEVVYWSTEKAFGFLRCVEPGLPRVDLFAFIREVKDRINLQVGDLVSADVIPSKYRPGRQDAVNIVLRKRDDVAKVSQ
jgi:hypothetical protein